MMLFLKYLIATRILSKLHHRLGFSAKEDSLQDKKSRSLKNDSRVTSLSHICSATCFLDGKESNECNIRSTEKLYINLIKNWETVADSITERLVLFKNYDISCSAARSNIELAERCPILETNSRFSRMLTFVLSVQVKYSEELVALLESADFKKIIIEDCWSLINSSKNLPLYNEVMDVATLILNYLKDTFKTVEFASILLEHIYSDDPFCPYTTELKSKFAKLVDEMMNIELCLLKAYKKLFCRSAFGSIAEKVIRSINNFCLLKNLHGLTKFCCLNLEKNAKSHLFFRNLCMAVTENRNEVLTGLLRKKVNHLDLIYEEYDIDSLSRILVVQILNI